jgi:hypothetical protein
MSSTVVRAALTALVLTCLSILPGSTNHRAHAGESYRSLHPHKYRVSRPGDVFYNYYVGPAPYAGGAAAGIFPSPVPTPPLVGHTYITYQPFMPNEFLYKHHRTYHRHHPGHGWVQTQVVWW